MKLTTAPNKHRTETVQIKSNQQTLRQVDLASTDAWYHELAHWWENLTYATICQRRNKLATPIAIYLQTSKNWPTGVISVLENENIEILRKGKKVYKIFFENVLLSCVKTFSNSP